MMAEQIVKDTMKFGLPKIHPYKSISDYIESRLTVHAIPQPKRKNDIARPDPEMFLIFARKEFTDTEKALIIMRDKNVAAKKDFAAQWEDLRMKQMDLRENFECLTGFVTGNNAKRTRAKANFAENTRLLAKRIVDIENLQEQLNNMQNFKADLDKEIMRYRLYEKCLDGAIANCDDFKNVDDVITRYESLTETKNELGEMQNKNMELLEVSKALIMKRVDEYLFRIVGLNTVVSHLHSRYSLAKSEAMHWEKLIWDIKARMFERFQEMTEVKQSSWNTYKMMCARRGEKTKATDIEIEKHLIYINKSMRELRMVKDEVIKTTKMVFNSMKPETSHVS